MPRFTRVIVHAVMAAVVCAGCATSPKHYDVPVTQGPAADFSGGWISEGGSHLFVLEQRGSRVTGFWHDLSIEGYTGLYAGAYTREHSRPVAGVVTGNVLRADVSNRAAGFAHMFPKRSIIVENFSFDMTLDPGGETGTCDYVLKCFPFPSGRLAERVYRVILGPAAGRVSGLLAQDLELLSGGLVCQLPVKNDGDTLLKVSPHGTIPAMYGEFPDYAVRKVFVTFQNEYDENSNMSRVWVMVPLDPPRVVSRYLGASTLHLAQVLGPGRFEAARAASRWGAGREVDAGGQRLWCSLAPLWLSAGAELLPGHLQAEVYRQNPAGSAAAGALPVEKAIVAQRTAGGTWQPYSEPAYLKSFRTLTAAYAEFENGRPVAAGIREIKEPPLEEFLELVHVNLQGKELVEYARWRTGILLQAKNETLPVLLREKSSDELVELVTKIERVILDLNHQASLAKDNAQQMVEKGEGDPALARELSHVYQERIEVLKPMIRAIKQELANRQR